MTIIDLLTAQRQRHHAMGAKRISRSFHSGAFQSFARRDIILREGAPVSSVAFLVTGTVALSILGHAWNNRIMMLLSDKEEQNWILDPTSLESPTHSVTCEALTEGEAYVVDKPTLTRLVQEDCALAYQIVRMLSRMTGRIVTEFQNQVVLPAPERLARILLQLARFHGRPGTRGIRLALPLKRQDLASLVGVTKETLIRTLHAFKREGLIDLIGPDIDILSESQLRTVANRTRPYLDYPS